LDITGRPVKTFFAGTDYIAGQAFNINIADLPAGLYNLSVVADGNRFIQKLIKH
jgi:uncharacterized protein (DUF2141 family)